MKARIIEEKIIAVVRPCITIYGLIGYSFAASHVIGLRLAFKIFTV